MLGDRIKKYRLELGLKQSELAGMVHVSQNTISYWESGRTEPNIGAIESLCKVFNCKKSDLLEFAPEISTNSDDIFLKISFDKNKKPSVNFISGNLNENEAALLEYYRNCDDSAKELVQRLLKYQYELQKKKDSEQ